MIKLVNGIRTGCVGCVLHDGVNCMRSVRFALKVGSCVFGTGVIDPSKVFKCIPPVPGIEDKLRTLNPIAIRCSSIKESKNGIVKSIKKEVVMSKVKTLNPNLTRVMSKGSGDRKCNGCLFSGKEQLCMDPCRRARTEAGFGCQPDYAAPDGYIYITSNVDLRRRYAQLADMEDQLKKATAERRKLTAEIKAALK